MLALFAQACFGVAGIAILGGLVELRSAWRFGRLRQGRAGDAGPVECDGIIEDDGGSLQAPLSRTACVLFSLVLTRRRIDASGRTALLFVEQRPFTVFTDGQRLKVDPKKDPVVIVGLDADDRALPFLPQGVLGLLVQRFGHMGHVWAEEYVVRGRESCLPVGAAVHALVQDGKLLTLSTKPLRVLARGALTRAGQAFAIAAPLVALGLWLR